MKLKPYFRPRQEGNSFFDVKDLCKIYEYPPPSETPCCVAVLSFGGGMYGNINKNGVLTDGDVQKYWVRQGILPKDMPTVIVKFIDGVDNDVGDKLATSENTLDVSIVGACCPTSKLTILLFICPNRLFSKAVNISLAGANGYIPTILSISWGVPESSFLYSDNTLKIIKL